MPKKWSSEILPDLIRTSQEDISYCGPATLQMLIEFNGRKTGQAKIVDAADAGHKIETHGTRVVDLAKATLTLFPDLYFWYKHEATINELAQITREFKWPVGVAWQGIFGRGLNSDAQDDPGHYSVVTKCEPAHNKIYLADPYVDFAGKDRQLSITEFKSRWWEETEVIDPITGKKSVEEDYRLMFVVAPVEIDFPQIMEMKQFTFGF
jgi:hypothetical protein